LGSPSSEPLAGSSWSLGSPSSEPLAQLLWSSGSPSSDPPARLSWPSGSPSSEPLAGSSWSGNMLLKKPSHDEKKTAHKTAPKQVVEGSQHLTSFQVGVMGISTRAICRSLHIDV